MPLPETTAPLDLALLRSLSPGVSDEVFVAAALRNQLLLSVYAMGVRGDLSSLHQLLVFPRRPEPQEASEGSEAASPPPERLSPDLGQPGGGRPSAGATRLVLAAAEAMTEPFTAAAVVEALRAAWRPAVSGPTVGTVLYEAGWPAQPRRGGIDDDPPGLAPPHGKCGTGCKMREGGQ